jgi:predicted dehydrogenase
MGIQKRSFDHGDALESELSAFVQSVRTRQKPSVSGQTGRDALHIALNIIEQIEKTAHRFKSFANRG